MLQGLFPVLLKLLNPRPPADEPSGEKKVQARPAAGAGVLFAAGFAGKKEDKPAAPEMKHFAAEGAPDHPALAIPLSFKHPLFREVGLYLVIAREKEEKPGEKDGLDFLLSITTENLGAVRLFLEHRRHSLRLNWFLQTEEIKKHLEKGFPALEKELHGAGYENIVINSWVLPQEENKNQARLQEKKVFFDSYV